MWVKMFKVRREQQKPITWHVIGLALTFLINMQLWDIIFRIDSNLSWDALPGCALKTYYVARNRSVLTLLVNR